MTALPLVETLLSLIDLVASPDGLFLVTQIATITFMIAGLALMLRKKHLAGRLALIGVMIVVVPHVIVASQTEIRSLILGTPRWLLLPILACGAAIVFCWLLWAVIALCFGPVMASRVTADILTWLTKGVILSVIAPWRGLTGLLRRLLTRDPIE